MDFLLGPLQPGLPSGRPSQYSFHACPACLRVVLSLAVPLYGHASSAPIGVSMDSIVTLLQELPLYLLEWVRLGRDINLRCLHPDLDGNRLLLLIAFRSPWQADHSLHEICSPSLIFWEPLYRPCSHSSKRCSYDYLTGPLYDSQHDTILELVLKLSSSRAFEW